MISSIVAGMKMGQMGDRSRDVPHPVLDDPEALVCPAAAFSVEAV
jgi:hypothetical protein